MISSGLQGIVQQNAIYNHEFIAQTRQVLCHNFKPTAITAQHKFIDGQASLKDRTETANRIDLQHLTPDEEIEHCLPAFFKADKVKQLASQLKCSFPKASQLEIKTQGTISQLKPGLFTGHQVLDNGDCAYIAMEQVTNTAVVRNKHWDDFHRMNGNAVANLGKLLSQFYGEEVIGIPDEDLQSEAFFKHHESPEVLLAMFQNADLKSSNVMKTLNRLGVMHVGMCEFRTRPGIDRNTKQTFDEIRYVAYVSVKPITGFAFEGMNREAPDYDKNLNELDTYLKHCPHIAMVIGSGQRGSGECVDGRGIYKTTSAVLSGLDGEKTVDNRSFSLSMLLHLFIKKTAYEYLNAGYYFASPYSKMVDIYKTTLAQEIENKSIIAGRDSIKFHNLDAQMRTSLGSETPVLTDLKKFKNPAWTSFKD